MVARLALARPGRVCYIMGMKLHGLFLCCCAVSAAAGYDGPPPLTENDGRAPIRMGAELMTGYRSDYVYRGERFGANALEGQISGGLSLSDNWALSGEMFAIRNWQGSKFRQDSLHGELQHYLTDECTLGLFVNGQWYDFSPMRNGVEPGLSLRWNPKPAWSFGGSLLYDTGQKGMYSEWSVTWQPLLTETLALSNTVSVGFAQDYLGRSGLKELVFRSGLLWSVSSNFRLEPFAGLYCGYGRDEFQKVVVGLWCSYSF